MMLQIYQFIIAILRPIYIRCILPYRIKIGKEDPIRVQEKLGQPTHARPTGKVLWIHAASVGESMSVQALIQRIKKYYPEWSILMTTVTMTGGQVVAKKFENLVTHQYLPLDFKNYVESFVAHWQPDCVLWVESEFWPTMLFHLKALQIPVISLNTRMSHKSFRHWCWFKNSLRKILGCFDAIFPQTLWLEAGLKKMGIHPVKFVGNLKFCAVQQQQPGTDGVAHAVSLKLRAADFSKRIAWLAASTHAGEEEVVIQAHLTLKRQFPNLVTIIVPRHPSRAGAIVKLCKQYNLNALLWSQMTGGGAEADIIVIDAIGLLIALYCEIKIVFVGGSLVPIGGHNIIEPAAQSCAVIHGPFMSNFSEILDQFNQAAAVIQVSDSKTLACVVENLVNDQALRVDKQMRAFGVVQDQQSTTQKILAELNPYLGQQP